MLSVAQPVQHYVSGALPTEHVLQQLVNGTSCSPEIIYLPQQKLNNRHSDNSVLLLLLSPTRSASFLYIQNPQVPNPTPGLGGKGHLSPGREAQSAIQSCTIGTRAPSKAIVGAH